MLHFCSMLHLCSVLFSYAAVLDLHDSGQNMLSSTCSYLVRCVAFNAPCMQHRGSAGSGRLTAIPDSQGLGASHLNGVLFWKKAFRVATLFCWKLVPWELPEVSASYMSDILNFTPYTPHFTFYTPHFTLYTPHSTIPTSHSTQHSPLNIPLSSRSTLCTSLPSTFHSVYSALVR